MSSFDKFLSPDSTQRVSQWCTKFSRPLVFTNGCFDILHRGHVDYLEKAAAYGESLIVGINSDASVKLQNKGDDRPVNTEQDRAAILCALGCVSGVVLFDQETPIDLINAIQPNCLIKGGDWPVEKIVGAPEVIAWGGEVVSIPFIHDRSTTAILKKIRSL